MLAQQKVVDGHRPPDLRGIGDILKMRGEIGLDARGLLHRIGLTAGELLRHRANCRRDRIVRDRNALHAQRCRRPRHPDVVVDDIAARLPGGVDIAPGVFVDLRDAVDLVSSDRQKQSSAD